MSTAIGKNPFIWYDVMTTDVESAQKFYTDVIGWSAENSATPGTQDYILFKANGTGVAGLMAIPEEAKAHGMPPVWAGYIYVDDVDEHAQKIAAAGGKIFREPSDIPGVGRFAVAGDPTGAGFIIFHPNMAEAGNVDNSFFNKYKELGHVGWHELHAGDLDTAWAFYSSMFGWEKTDSMDMGEDGLYQMWGIGGVTLGAMLTKTKDTPVPFWAYYINVASIDAALEKVNAGGGKVVMGPVEVPGGQWIAHCQDPQGAYFAMVANAK